MEAKRADAALVVVSLVNVLFFSGIMFGWGPFLVMLEEEGQYAELCPDAAPCADRGASARHERPTGRGRRC